MHTIKLPRKHAEDWWHRCGEEKYGEYVDSTERYVTLKLTKDGLEDLKQDIDHFIDCMFGEYTDFVDYRPAAQRCKDSLINQGYWPQ